MSTKHKLRLFAKCIGDCSTGYQILGLTTEQIEFLKTPYRTMYRRGFPLNAEMAEVKDEDAYADLLFSRQYRELEIVTSAFGKGVSFYLNL